MGVKLGPCHFKKNKLLVFMNRVLRKICGSKMDKVIGGSRKLHNEKLLDLQGRRWWGSGAAAQGSRVQRAAK
jgi:hypothetical protein